MISKAYKEGRKRFRNRPSNGKNPYDPKTREWIDFDRGFYSEMRKAPVNPANYYDDSHYFEKMVDGKLVKIKTLAEEKLERIKTQGKEKAIEAYRNRKGR